MLAVAIWALSSGFSPADGIKTNCDAKKARAADLWSYVPVSGKKPAPTTTFFDSRGAERSIADYRGRAIVLNFWATWCPPCVREMPSLDRMKVALANDGIEVIAVSEDRKGVEHVQRYFDKLGLKHLDLLMDRDQALMRAANVSSLPTTLLIDEHGSEVAGVLRDAEWDSPAIVQFVRSCLKPGQ